MKIGDRIFVRGYIDEIRKDTVIVRNDGGYFGTVLSEVTGELPSAQPEHRWIPCSEQLPAYGEDVLISIGGYCNVGHIVPVNEEEQYNWYFSGWYHLPNDVDAWMPLPEPYKENSDGH